MGKKDKGAGSEMNTNMKMKHQETSVSLKRLQKLQALKAQKNSVKCCKEERGVGKATPL